MDNLTVSDFVLLSMAAIPCKLLKSNSTAIVLHGSVGSTVGIRYNVLARNSTSFPTPIVSQIVGHLLGDGALVMSRTSTTPAFVFTQTIKRFAYLWQVFLTLSHYCQAMPRVGISRKVHLFMQIHTRSYPILLALYNLFYQLIDGKYVKVITPALLTYIDAIALAYWAMDDGAKITKGTGFYLHTKGFTFAEVYLLVGMLHYNFGLVCTVQNHSKQPVIFITAASMPLFISLVKPHFHSTMMYKIS